MKKGLGGSHCIWAHSFHRTYVQQSCHASRRGPKDPIGRKYEEKADPHMVMASLPFTPMWHYPSISVQMHVET